MKEIIKIKDLSFSYQEQIIFNNFNLNIKENDFVSIIGPNGSGKSTLIRILTGLNDYNGYININGYYLSKEQLKNIRREIGVVFDDTDNHFIGETVIDDLAFTLENLSYSKEQIKEKITYISSLFKIEDILYKEPDSINNSNKQKVAIASSIIHDPKILILDESLHQLNQDDKKTVFEALKKYKNNHQLTIVLITHNVEDTLYSNRIIVLNKGNIYLDGSVEDVYKEERKLKLLGINIPFVIKLSAYLKLYNLIDETYVDANKLVEKLW